MPRIRRWFHVSHDINSDPEVWELRRRFGDRTLGVWLEILSIADRYDGHVPGDRDYLAMCVSSKCQVTKRTVLKVFEYAETKLWLVSDPVLRVRNHTKYRVVRDANKIPSGISKASPPLLDTPLHSYVKEVISYLNEKTGKRFKANGHQSTKHIQARINEGFTVEDLKKVVDIKTEEWFNDAKYFRYLRPETLFGNKCEAYLQEGIDTTEDPNP